MFQDSIFSFVRSFLEKNNYDVIKRKFNKIKYNESTEANMFQNPIFNFSHNFQEKDNYEVIKRKFNKKYNERTEPYMNDFH